MAAVPLDRVGVQSFSFRNFDLSGALEQLDALGAHEMEFCAVHIPPNPEDPAFVAAMKAIQLANVVVPSYGVEQFGSDQAANRARFVLAKQLGASVLTADPAPEAFEHLEELCREFDIRIAIHNHGPGARYDKAADTLSALARCGPMIGACVDTGHVIRSGETPDEVIKVLGERVLSVHLKDWKQGGKETVLGEGDLSLPAVVEALRAVHFEGPLMMEYELEPENPVPGMKRGLANWLSAGQ